MYSYEIDSFINGRDSISVDEYKDISDLRKNPQIDHIKLDTYSGKYHIWTTDGYHWEFYVVPY